MPASGTVSVVTQLRAVLGLVCGAAVAALGALILGEYEFTGTLPYVAGPLFGFIVGEVVVGVGRSRSGLVALVAGLMAAAGLAWAGWIDSTEGVEPIKALAWVAAGLGFVVAVVRTYGLPTRSTRGPTADNSPSASEQP